MQPEPDLLHSRYAPMRGNRRRDVRPQHATSGFRRYNGFLAGRHFTSLPTTIGIGMFKGTPNSSTTAAVAGVAGAAFCSASRSALSRASSASHSAIFSSSSDMWTTVLFGQADREYPLDYRSLSTWQSAGLTPQFVPQAVLYDSGIARTAFLLPALATQASQAHVPAEGLEGHRQVCRPRQKCSPGHRLIDECDRAMASLPVHRKRVSTRLPRNRSGVAPVLSITTWIP